jgi:hypothetical protein
MLKCVNYLRWINQPYSTAMCEVICGSLQFYHFKQKVIDAVIKFIFLLCKEFNHQQTGDSSLQCIIDSTRKWMDLYRSGQKIFSVEFFLLQLTILYHFHSLHSGYRPLLEYQQPLHNLCKMHMCLRNVQVHSCSFEFFILATVLMHYVVYVFAHP